MEEINYKEKYKQTVKELKKLKKIIKLVQDRELYYIDLDYDWDENPIETAVPFDLEEEVNAYLGIKMKKSSQKKIMS